MEFPYAGLLLTNVSTASDSTLAGFLPVAAAVAVPAPAPTPAPIAAPFPPPTTPPIMAPAAVPPPILATLLLVCEAPLITNGWEETFPLLMETSMSSRTPGSLNRPDFFAAATCPSTLPPTGNAAL